MADFQQTVVGYTSPDGQFTPLPQGQTPYFQYNQQYLPADASTLSYNAYNGVSLVLWSDTRGAYNLPPGTAFVLRPPQAPVAPQQMVAVGYYEGQNYSQMQPGEEAMYSYNGQYFPVKTQEDVEWAKSSASYPCVSRGGQVRWLTVGTVFYLQSCMPTPQTYSPRSSLPYSSAPPQQFPAAPPQQFPAAPPQQLSAGPVPLFNVAPASLQQSPQFVPEKTPAPAHPAPTPAHPAPAHALASKECSECLRSKPNFENVQGIIICYDCLLEKISSNNLFGMKKKEKQMWSTETVKKVYDLLQVRFTDKQLPPIPNPPDSFVCLGEDRPSFPGYPPKGHFIGTSNIVRKKNEGCPNDHILCRKCAGRLEQCPVCQADVIFEEDPVGCPSGEQGGCARFDSPCVKCGKKWNYRKKVNANRGQPITEEAQEEKPKAEEVKVEEPKAEKAVA